MNKLEQMVELVKKLELGQVLPFRDLEAKVMAFSDEAVYLSVPEIRVEPDLFDAQTTRVDDRALREARNEIMRLKQEMEHMLEDSRYYEYKRSKEHHYRDRMRQLSRETDRSYRDMYLSPNYTGIYGGSEFTSRVDLPKREMWIDPLSYKEPTQKGKK